MLGIDLAGRLATGVWLSATGVVIAALRADPKDLLRDGTAGGTPWLLRDQDAVLTVSFDATPDQRVRAERAGRRTALTILGVLTEPVAAALGRLPAFRTASRPVPLLVVAPGRFVSVLEWRGTSVNAIATARAGSDVATLADRVLEKVAVPWGAVTDVVIVGADAAAPGVRESFEARWGRPVILPSDPELAVAYGAAKVGLHLRQQRAQRTPGVVR